MGCSTGAPSMNHVLFETARLRAEPFGEVHLAERYVDWLADPDVVRWSEQRHRNHTLASCREYMDSFRGTPHIFAALVAKDPALGHVGNMNVYFDERHQTADIGILLGERTIWGRGYGTEAWRGMMRWVFRNRPVRKITGGCIADNRSMVGIMRSCGMVDDGCRTRQYLYEGREVDLVYAAAFRDTWMASHAGRSDE